MGDTALLVGAAMTMCCAVALVVGVLLYRSSTKKRKPAPQKKAGAPRKKPASTVKTVGQEAAAGVVSGSGVAQAGNVPCPPWITRNPNPQANTDAVVARAKAASAGRANVVFIGDSITSMLDTYNLDSYKRNLGDKGNLVLLGVGGDIVENAMWRLCQAYVQSDAYVVLLGTNNISQNTPPAPRLKDLVRFIRARSPSAHIIILGIMPRGVVGGLPTDRMDMVNAANREMEAFAKASDAKMHYAPWTEKLMTLPGDFPDLLHPSEIGWRKVLDKVFPYIQYLFTR